MKSVVGLAAVCVVALLLIAWMLWEERSERRQVAEAVNQAAQEASQELAYTSCIDNFTRGYTGDYWIARTDYAIDIECDDLRPEHMP